MTHLRPSLTLSSGLLALAIGSAAPAHAQTLDTASRTTSFQIEHFEPLPAQGPNIANIASSRPLLKNELSFGMTMHYVDDPLQVRTDGEVTRLVDDQLTAELTAAYGLFGLGDVGLALPVVLHQSTNDLGDFGDEPAPTTTVGDLRFVARAGILDPSDARGFGVGLALPVFLPTGNTASFNGDGTVRVEPRVAADWTHESGLRVLANVGYQIRSERVALTYVSNDLLRLGAAVEVPAGLPDLRATASLFGHFPLVKGRDPANPTQAAPNSAGQPFEGQVGVRYEVTSDVLLHAGGGVGLTSGVGAPDFRILGGIEWSPQLQFDADGDGVKNNADQCAGEPEDIDGFEDDDGCPDFDNDEDLVADVDDRCPDEYEDQDDFEDRDGCPDPDNDGDGLLDDDDRCPDVAGLQELMGCPAEDDDGDGLANHLDECPGDAEDPDGFEDDDGCPDLDNDGDGLVDTIDTCPTEAEVINENSDTDGCPDEGATKVRVTLTEIETLEPVEFASRSRVHRRSRAVLNQVAAALANHRRIELVRIEVHTASRGNSDANMKLSAKWAEAVRDYLVDEGVDPERLDAEGFGDTQPLNPDDPEANENVRVEFIIATIRPLTAPEEATTADEPDTDADTEQADEQADIEEDADEAEGFNFGEDEVE